MAAPDARGESPTEAFAALDWSASSLRLLLLLDEELRGSSCCSTRPFPLRPDGFALVSASCTGRSLRSYFRFVTLLALPEPFGGMSCRGAGEQMAEQYARSS